MHEDKLYSTRLDRLATVKLSIIHYVLFLLQISSDTQGQFAIFIATRTAERSLVHAQILTSIGKSVTLWFPALHV